MSAIKTTQIDGDVTIGRNLALGGKVVVQGDGHFKGNVNIDGWLEAKNIKGALKGLFASLERLRKAYPEPLNGWFALVGNSIPAPVFIAQDGEWIATGEDGGALVFDADSFSIVLDGIQQSVLVLQQGQKATKEELDALKGGELPEVYDTMQKQAAAMSTMVMRVNSNASEIASKADRSELSALTNEELNSMFTN